MQSSKLGQNFLAAINLKRGGPAGQKSGAQYKTGLVGERKLQPYASHDHGERELP